uniref:Uncharacterized protein n=1 Tax=Oryzias melastigma TaxID=30732 RepID=A0A3B3E3A7_ORYME
RSSSFIGPRHRTVEGKLLSRTRTLQTGVTEPDQIPTSTTEHRTQKRISMTQEPNQQVLKVQQVLKGSASGGSHHWAEPESSRSPPLRRHSDVMVLECGGIFMPLYCE